MPQLRKSTRYILVEFRGTAMHKPFYRRGGHVFQRGQKVLVDVAKADAAQIESVLSDQFLTSSQLTEKQSEKYERELADQAKRNVAKTDESELVAALGKAREQYKRERERADALERQGGELIAEVELLQSENDVLERRVAELSQYVDIVDEKPSADPAPAPEKAAKG